MTLYDICMDIADVENGLAYGEIRFTYDKLMSAMKPGHPADLLDDIFCDIGNELFIDENAPIDTARLKEMLTRLQDFKQAFKVKELSKPIRDLTAYIKKQEENENGMG